jgi:hypothetical protein
VGAPPDHVVAQLYTAPLRSFVRERDARAAALREAGRTEEARAVRRLRRPAIPLWAVNQLAHADPERLAALIDAVGRARAVQLRDPRGAAEALRHVRADLQALVKRAGDVLGGQGYRLTPATSRRISDTLLGAAADRRLAADLRRGRLMAEVPAPGFEVLSGAARPLTLVQGGGAKVEPRRSPPVTARGETETSRAKREKAEAARRARAVAADEERARRRREADALGREAAAREEAVQQARRAVAEAAAALAQVSQRLRDATGAAKAASAAARRARRAAK